jgi:hypothetical protein
VSKLNFNSVQLDIKGALRISRDLPTFAKGAVFTWDGLRRPVRSAGFRLKQIKDVMKNEHYKLSNAKRL